jgi:hypothetical protein
VCQYLGVVIRIGRRVVHRAETGLAQHSTADVST